MTAKEMFEKLGYKMVKDTKSQNVMNWEIIYETETDYVGRKAQFKFFPDSFYAQLYEEEKLIGGCYIGEEQLQAINKQIEELRWNDERTS